MIPDEIRARSFAALANCREVACLFAFGEVVWQVDAKFGGKMLSRNATHIEDLKQEVVHTLSRHGTELHENLTQQISQEYISDLGAFYDIWNHLQTFIGMAQNASIASQLESLVQTMKLVDERATAKMNLAALMDRMLGSAKSFKTSGEVPKLDLMFISSTMSQAKQLREDIPALSAAYREWTAHLCAGLSEFAGEVKSSSMFVAIHGPLKLHLEGCLLEDALDEAQKSVGALLETKAGVQEVRKALDAESGWFSRSLPESQADGSQSFFSSLGSYFRGGNDKSSALVRAIRTYLEAGLDDQLQELRKPDPDFDLVAAFEKFEHLRTELWVFKN